jgi:hypothetical protein
MVFQAQFCQIHTYCNITPKGEFHVFIFISIDSVDLFTDATHKSILSFSDKWNAVLKDHLWKWQKTVGCLLLFQSLLLLVSGGHSLHPDASSFCPYCQVKLSCLWPNKATDFIICHHARRQLIPPLKVPGVSRCLITSLLRNLYTII